MMKSFPAAPGQQVTTANWMQAPFNRWAFQHLREIFPTAEVANDGERLWRLPRAQRDLMALPIPGHGATVADWLEANHSDGLVVLHHGAIVAELYRHGMTAERSHLVFSVTKALVGLVVGILVDQGRLDPDALVTRYLPEITGGYADTTLRHNLDMTVDLDWDDTSSDPGSTYQHYRDLCFRGLEGDGTGLRGWLKRVGRGPGPHSHGVRYITSNTDLLAWICERVTGEPFADLISRLIWRPLGAERPASVMLDRLGAPLAGGGFSCTLRDLARLGELVRCRGFADGRQAVPSWWIEDIFTGGDPAAWARCSFADMLPPGARYRSQWYLADSAGNVAMAIGAFGQWIWMNRAKGVVIAKVSSLPQSSGSGYPLEQAAYAAITEAL